MSNYGVQPTGFVRKPLERILKEIEAGMVETFGPDVIQTSESPQGQINGLFASAVSDLWGLGLEIYQSFDPDQAVQTRLTSIAKLRTLSRGGFNDIELRKEINNIGVTRFNLKDIVQELQKIDGITYLQPFLNDDGDLTSEGLVNGDVCIAIIGGDDTQLADKLMAVMPIGGTMYGNTTINTSPATGISQQFKLHRITEIDISLDLVISLVDDTFSLFQPDSQQIIEGLVQGWAEDRINGRDVNHHTLRTIIESKYPAIKLDHFTATIGTGSAQAQDAAAVINFNQIASIISDNVTAVYS